MTRIDQFVPGFSPHDAIGGHVLQLRRLLRSHGIDSDIWGEHIDPRLHGEARHFSEAPLTAADRIVIYQLSTHSAMADWMAAASRAGQEVWADYHNITPARYFARWEPDAAASMVAARKEMARLAPVVSRSMADSQYNEAELVATGYTSTTTAPLLVDLDRYHDEPDARTLERLRRRRGAGGSDWLFVGRIAPNKCQHDVIAAFAAYRRLFEPRARLTLVGGATSLRYLRSLQGMVAELGLGDSVEMLDNVAMADLLAHFATADVFVCMSEHEGFCVPVLEAFELGVPVVAFSAAAVPETVGEAGVLLHDKDPLHVAEAVRDLLGDDTRRAALAAAGRRRAAEFSLAATSAHMVATVDSWLGEQAPPANAPA